MSFCAHCKTEKDAKDFSPSRPRECRVCRKEKAKSYPSRVMAAEYVRRSRAKDPNRAALWQEKKNAARRKGTPRPEKYGHSEGFLARRAAEEARIAALPSWVRQAIDSLIGLRRSVVLAACNRRTRERHPEDYRRRNMFHNAKGRGFELGDSMLTAAQWEERLEEFGSACAYCLRTDRKLTIDHMIPLTRGGSHSLENAIPACKPCNSRKGNRSIFRML